MKIISYGFISISLAFLAAVVLGLAGPDLNSNPSYDNLASVAMIPYWVGILLLGTILAMVGTSSRTRFLSILSWWILLATTGMVGGLKLLHLWEGYHLLPDPTGYFGMSNLYEVTLLLGWIFGVVGLFFSKSNALLNLAVAVVLVANAALALWLHGLGVAGPQPLVPALQSYWLPWHVLANFIAYACFLVAGCAGSVILYTKNQAQQTQAGKIIDQSITVGLSLFTIAIVLGAAWAAEAWGGYWSWDPKETWALITWLVYAGYVHSRSTPKLTHQKQAIWAIAGFISTLICYLGVNLFMDGLHSYGSIG